MKNFFDRFRHLGHAPSRSPVASPSRGQPPEIDRTASRSTNPVFPSKVFRDFLEMLSRKDRPVILDTGPLIGSNVEYFFNLGVKVHVEDVVGAYQNPRYWNLVEGQRLFDEIRFLEENLDYEEGTFDGLIIWDLLNFIEPKFARSFAQKIALVTKPGACILAFVHTQNPPPPGLIPIKKYRLVEHCSLEYIPSGVTLEFKKTYQTRDITQLFVGYQATKFYLLKHNILEVLLKKE